jgi:hypothetical protein
MAEASIPPILKDPLLEDPEGKERVRAGTIWWGKTSMGRCCLLPMVAASLPMATFVAYGERAYPLPCVNQWATKVGERAQKAENYQLGLA